MLRLMSASMLEARFSRVWRASSSSPWRMSSMTLAQIAEKPITVTTDEAISSFADSRQGRSGHALRRRPNRIIRSRSPLDAPEIVAAGLSDDNDVLIS